MSKLSDISKIFVKSHKRMQCQKCQQTIAFSINENVYINLMTGRFMIECPFCKGKYTLDLSLELEKEKKDE